jgi:hypothetical protein
MSLAEKYKPAIPRRGLLMVAGVFWTFAGGMLLWRGLSGLFPFGRNMLYEIPIGIAGGLLFFFLLFQRISKKHVKRMLSIEIDKPCFFSFFDVRAYILMTIMISAGVSLRIFKLVDPQILYTFYVCMGIPLLMSAFRFYYNWYIFNRQV